MNINNLIKNISWLFLVIFLLLGITYFLTLPDNNNGTSDIKPTPLPTNESVQYKYNPDIKTTAWIANWAWDSGVEGLEKHQNKMYSVSPVWYELNADGTLVDLKKSDSAKFIKRLKSQNIKLIPTIANFDHELFDKVLQNQESIDMNIRLILEEVDKYNYDGIDLDYESIQLDDKTKYFEMLKQLSAELQKREKELVVTVVAKWSDEDIYKGLRETRKVQDWSEIAKYSDEIRIMTYDYTFSGSKFPGPIAPLNWMEQVAQYALTKVPAEKLMLGIHLYSYEWWIEDDMTNPDLELALDIKYSQDDNYTDNSRKVRSYTHDVVQQLISEVKGDTIDYQGEKFFTYSKINDKTNKNEKRVLVYIDKAGIDMRKELAKKYGFKGVAFWRLGNEADLI